MKFKMKRVLSFLVAFAMLFSSNLDCMSIAAAVNGELADKDFVLTMETKTGDGYNAHLTWNDISDKENRYGYKILRRKEAGEWETRSTWDGEEKVRVLNIYPCEAAKNYLKNWMSQPLDKNPTEMAGKGLFDIDTVAIDTYNTDPDYYLKDKEGNYQYDVLMFGTYDGNSGKDLSSNSYEATQRFVDSGRGVLFGHDTVTSNTTVDNPQFSRFADQMGIKLTRDGSVTSSNRVKVVNQGFLTSYPWKLSGTLIIPTAHALGQFVGGTTTATVWMKFDVKCKTDAETGASNDGYLYSKNALAMIQTGHSNGQATDDERMVLANTLFYLKQNTSTTSSVDQSFYDEAAPEAPEVKVESLDTIHLVSKDLGTEYEYKVEAVPGITDQPSYQTNICKATAESGLKGFITGVSASEEPMKDLLVYGEDGSLKSEVTKAQDGKAVIDISKYEPGVKYLHVYAVDNAGNVSKETVTKVKIPNIVTIDSMKTVADTYVLEADENQDLTFTTDIGYTVKPSCEGKVKYSFLEDGKEIKTWEKNIVLEQDKNSLLVDSEIEITTSPDATYELKVDLYTLDEENQEVLAKSETVTFTLTKLKEFKLTADVTSGKDYSVDLAWSDLNDGKNRYGYRVFRSKEGGPWETCSTWNGQEKVKVLNIYPCANAKNYLKNWMDSPLSNSSEKAGMGLFDIDTVSIGSYNSNPNAYLKDADGNYKYDVLMFGTYDRNADQDLTEKSFSATQAFIDSGRGVLFGHDTVTRNSTVNHPVFARFSEQLGAKLTYNGSFKATNKVDVVNQAFITSYPWKLSGTLTIPMTHALGQYTGGTTQATVWMRLKVNNITDAETGATDNAYLFSRNALAMIQTGHSSGQATDDERKVFANTLFYLKQSSSETSARDQSFYDETAPEVPAVDAADFEAVTLTSADKGTNYQYYVEGIPANTEKKNRQTNIVDAQALSGLRGFIIGISDSKEPMKDLLIYNKDGSLKSEVTKAENGKAVYDASEAEPGVEYLHVYAVDNAGNVSEEQVTEVLIPDRVVIDSVKTVPDSLMLKPYEVQTVHVTTTLDYAVRPDCQGILRYKILENGKEISSWNKEVTLYRAKNRDVFESETEISVYPESEYTLIADFYTITQEKEEVLQKSEVIPLTVDVSKLKDFILAANATTGKEYKVDLAWTDLTDEESSYGYNVYRSKEGSDWENCATSENETVDGTIITKDPAFYDEAVPEMPVVDATKLDEVKLTSTDKGTSYQYFVESVPANKKKISRKTNTADAVAQSEIKGFIVGVSESEEPMCELLTYNEDGQLVSDVIPAEEGIATFDVSKYKSGTEYIHVYAVDNAGNVSDETVVEVVVPKEYFETPYALFASDDVMQMYCCEANIQGDVYGKEKFFCQGSQLHLNGTASTANKFTFANGVTDIKDSKEGIEPVILPDYMEHILVNMRADSEWVDNINAYNSTDINVPTLCKSTTGAWCAYVNLNASLVAQESISLNAQGVSGGKDKPIVIASQNGDIRIQTIDFEGSGLIYAPNGTVVINVNNFNYTGTIIAKKIEIQASYYNHSLLTSY